MRWFSIWTEAFKKNACRYLLQHYIGQFLKEKLTVDQLSIDLFKGTGTIKDVSLDVAAINDVLESSNIPVELVDGFVGSIHTTIPWTSLVNDNTCMEVRNLEITVQPKQRDGNAGMTFDSMFSSFNAMTTSMQVAEECLKSESGDVESQPESAKPYEGLEIFAHTIEAVLCKVKMTFFDTIVRLEHLPKEAKSGAAVEIRIKRIDYFDDLADERSGEESASSGKVYEPVAVAHKNIHMVGVTVYCDEFSASSRTQARDSMTEAPQTGVRFGESVSPPFSPVNESVIADQPMKQFTETGSKEAQPVKIAVLMGTQKIKVKLKQQEELAGPKVEVDTQLGVVNFHLSPRQVHLLMEIAEGLATPDLCDDSNVRKKRFTTSKPMQVDDFTRIENELQRELHQQNQQHILQGAFDDDMSSILTAHGLDADAEDIFLSLGSTKSGAVSMEGSYTSHTSVKSSTTSGSLNPFTLYRKPDKEATVTKAKSSASTRSRQRTRDTVQKVLKEPGADITRYKLKLSFVSAMVLHEDPLNSPNNGIDPVVTSQEKLYDMAEKYFGRVLGIDIAGAGHDLVAIRAQFSQACPYDHLSLLAKPVMLDLSQKSSNQMYTLSGDVTIGVAEVVEALYGRTSVTHEVLSMQYSPDSVPPEYCELLVFEHDQSPDGGTSTMYSTTSSTYAPSSPDVRIKITSLDKTYQSLRGSPNKTDIHVELSACQGELDITIVDRINSLLNRQPLAASKRPAAGGVFGKSGIDPSIYHSCAQTAFSQAMEEAPGSGNRKTEVRVTSSKCIVTLRFPRIDLSAGPGMKPWWKRSLQNELLFLELSDLEFKTSSWPQQSVQQFEFTFRDGHGLFQVSAAQDPVSFIRISTADNPLDEREEGFDWPRFVIKLFAEHSSVLSDVYDDVDDQLHDESMVYDACSAFSKTHTTPFSQKTAMYDNQEMVLPGDRQEMLDYEYKAQSCTRVLMELSIPSVNANIPNKDFLELLYNRVLSDIALWEPTAPVPVEQMSMLSSGMQPLYHYDIHPNQPESFQACKSNIRDDSDSDLEESMPYLSMHELRRRQRKRQAKQPSGRQQSKMCLSINITKGELRAYVPLKGEEAMHFDNESGMFVLLLDDATVFCEVEHNGDPELMYTCVHSNNAQLYHQGCVPVPNDAIVIHRSNHQAPPEVDKTVYLSDPGTYTKLSDGHVGRGPDSNDMISVAVKVRFDMAKNVKECKVAVGVRAATLLHRVTPSGHDWFTQLLELLNLLDYQIPGYKPPKVITELHAHIWSSAIDYRPLYLPHRSMLTFESFTISSNVLADSSTSLLRFLVQEAALYISDKTDKHYIDLKKNYVCVADMGMFELALKTSDGTDPKYPTKLDLTVSNNIVHIRTCPDSMRAVFDLINYLASVGDLQDPADQSYSNMSADTGRRKGFAERTDTASSNLSSSPQLTQSSLESVNDMMADAMKDHCDSDTSSKDESPDTGITDPKQLFFTPQPGTPPTYPQTLPGPPSQSDDDSDSTKQENIPVKPYSKKKKSAPTKIVSQPKRDSVDFGMDGSINFSKGTGDSSPEVSLHLGSPGAELESRSPTLDDDYSCGAYRASDDDFCIIDSPGLGIRPRNGKPEVKMLISDPIKLIDNYFAIPMGQTDDLKAPDHFPPAVKRYTMREVSVVWYMYGGKDFDTSPSSKTSTKTERALDMQRMRTSRLSKLGWQAIGGQGRDLDVLMEVQLSKIRMRHELYPENTEQASRQILLISDIEIRDRLASSKINKFLYQYSSHKIPKQSHTTMLLMKALHVRPDLKLARQECSLKVSVQPLRFNIDQDAFNFMRVFKLELCGGEADEVGAAAGSSEAADGVSQPPIMQVAQSGDEGETLQFAELVDQEGLLEAELELGAQPPPAQEQGREEAPPIFIRSFVFSNDVLIRLDYHGKRADMGQGTLLHLIVGLAQLNCSELTLKRLRYKKGLLGVDKLGRYVCAAWLQDITRNQLPSILGGLGPMYSLVQIVHGIRDLFWMPVEQYRRDGRIVRGVQRGAQSFVHSTAMSTLELANRLVLTVQFVGELGTVIVGSECALIRQKKRQDSRLWNSPRDFREGVSKAYDYLLEGVKVTATDIVKGAVQGHEHKGVPGAVGGVLKQVPGAILQPVILATGATSNILDGVKNQMQPDKKKEDDEKWKPEDS